jgi:HlyD family secretion protein
MSKRILRVAVPVVVLGAVAAWLIASGKLGGKQPSDKLTLYGNVDIRQVELGFRVAGRIAAMKLEEGEAVKSGAVLAELDVRSYQDDVRAAQAQVAQQAAALEKLERGPRRAEIAQTRATLRERKASLDNARTGFERAQRLYASDAIPKASFDDSRTALDTSKAHARRMSRGRGRAWTWRARASPPPRQPWRTRASSRPPTESCCRACSNRARSSGRATSSMSCR